MKRFLLTAVVTLLAASLSGCGQVAGPSLGASPSGAAIATPSGRTSPPSAPATGSTQSTAVATSPGTPSDLGLHGTLIGYIKDDDVWVVATAGGEPIRVTTDGASGAYTDPSFAPDGSLYVLRNKDQLLHIDLAGHALAAPVTLAVLENGGEGLSVAPDGNHLAYVTTGFGTYVDPRFGTPNGAFIYGGTDVIGPDGTSVPDAAMASMVYPSWGGSGQLVMTDGTAIYADSIDAAPAKWLDLTDGCLIPTDCPAGQAPATNLTRPVISHDGSVLAYESQPYYGTGGRQMVAITSPPPAPTGTPCQIDGQQNFSDAGSLSPDGALFAYDDSQFDPTSFETTAGSGVWVMSVDLSAPDCGASSARLVGPGGLEPDLSPLLP